MPPDSQPDGKLDDPSGSLSRSHNYGTEPVTPTARRQPVSTEQRASCFRFSHNRTRRFQYSGFGSGRLSAVRQDLRMLPRPRQARNATPPRGLTASPPEHERNILRLHERPSSRRCAATLRASGETRRHATRNSVIDRRSRTNRCPEHVAPGPSRRQTSTPPTTSLLWALRLSLSSQPDRPE